MKKLIAIIAFALCFVVTNATHLTNGSMYYEYIGTETNGDYRYKVILVLVRDCVASTVGFDDDVSLGLYQPSVSGYKLVSSLFVYKTSEVAISNNGVILGQGSNLCFREARYEREVILKPNINDYVITFIRCCRPTLNSIIDESGNTYFVKINTGSPIYNTTPKLYSEAPTVISPSAKYFGSLKNYDINGDSCSYHLVDAIGGASSNMPLPSPSPNISLPFVKVVYRTTDYSGQELLGKSPAYFNLNSVTGNFTAFPKSQGRYLLAYEVKEWRNGQLIGTHYREMLLLVVSIHPQFLNTIALKAYTPFNLVKKITLNWGHNKQQTDSGYILERRTYSNPTWQPVATFDSTVYNYTDTLIDFDTLYFYRVKGYNGTTAVYSNNDSAIVRKKTVGIHNPIDTKSVRVYPNPVTDKLYFDIRGREIPQSIIIYTLQGKHIKTMILDAHVINSGIDISVLPSGIYYIQIQTQQGIQTQKIVKQ